MSNEPGDTQLQDQLDALRRRVAGLGEQSPPPSIDAAILASSRAAVRPTRAGRRWWVPATVAATVVIAFSLVMRVQQDAAVEPVVAPVFQQDAPVPAAAEADASVEAGEAAAAAKVAPAAPPVVERPVVTPIEGAAREAVSVQAAPMEARAQSPPAPEAWLARIESLEAEGKLEQAAAERERLEAAYPGWLAQHAAGQE
jgi:hypothetical protein